MLPSQPDATEKVPQELEIDPYTFFPDAIDYKPFKKGLDTLLSRL